MENVNKEIIAWVQAQPHWVQLAVTKVFGQAEVKDDLIDELLVLLKTAEGQSKDTKIDLELYFSITSSQKSDIRIADLKPVRLPLQTGSYVRHQQ